MILLLAILLLGQPDERTLNSVCMVQTHVGDAYDGGTGFVIYNDDSVAYVLTAGHVVQYQNENEPIILYFGHRWRDVSYEAEIVVRSDYWEWDLAILKIYNCPSPSLKFSTEDIPYDGVPSYLVGFYGECEHFMAYPIVVYDPCIKTHLENEEEYDWILWFISLRQIQDVTIIVNGTSGGPIISAEDNKVIGMMQSAKTIHTDYPRMYDSKGIDIRSVQDWLNIYMPNWTYGKPQHRNRYMR